MSKEVVWLKPGEDVDIIGPFGKVRCIVISYKNQMASLRVLPETELPSPKLLSEREQLKEARRPHE